MKKNLLLLFLAFFCCSWQAIAQRAITGKVTAAEDGYPLPGVSVKIKGTTTGTQTDTQGAYSTRVNAGQTLVFSFVGTVTQERAVGAATCLNLYEKKC